MQRIMRSPSVAPVESIDTGESKNETDGDAGSSETIPTLRELEDSLDASFAEFETACLPPLAVKVATLADFCTAPNFCNWFCTVITMVFLLTGSGVLAYVTFQRSSSPWFGSLPFIWVFAVAVSRGGLWIGCWQPPMSFTLRSTTRRLEFQSETELCCCECCRVLCCLIFCIRKKKRINLRRIQRVVVVQQIVNYVVVETEFGATGGMSIVSSDNRTTVVKSPNYIRDTVGWYSALVSPAVTLWYTCFSCSKGLIFQRSCYFIAAQTNDNRLIPITRREWMYRGAMALFPCAAKAQSWIDVWRSVPVDGVINDTGDVVGEDVPMAYEVPEII